MEDCMDEYAKAVKETMSMFSSFLINTGDVCDCHIQLCVHVGHYKWIFIGFWKSAQLKTIVQACSMQQKVLDDLRSEGRRWSFRITRKKCQYFYHLCQWFKVKRMSWSWWCLIVILPIGVRLRQEEPWVGGQPGLYKQVQG